MDPVKSTSKALDGLSFSASTVSAYTGCLVMCLAEMFYGLLSEDLDVKFQLEKAHCTLEAISILQNEGWELIVGDELDGKWVVTWILKVK